MSRVALMAAFTAVAAQIAVPLPFTPVPITFQVLAVVLSGLLLGPRLGALSQTVYLLLGAAGAPVFTAFSGGAGAFVGPTGGYLVSYPLAATLAGLAAGAITGSSRTRALWSAGLAGTAALAAIYTLGATWYSVVTGLPPAAVVAQSVLPFIPLDLAKVALAVLVATAAAPAIATRRAG
jgi:biotin transport system substrate-specific component